MRCGYGSRARTWVLLLGSLGVAPGPATAQDLDDRVAERVRNRVETAGFSGEIEAASAPIYAVATVSDFYVRRLYRPGWSTGGRIHSTAAQLIQELRGATAEGLDPADYHLEEIERLLGRARAQPGSGGPVDARLLADLDLLLTDTFLIYGSHLLSGRVNPETFDPEWIAARRGANLAAVLEEALGSGTVGERLRSLLPRQPGYGRLKEALATYRDIALGGGWEPVPADQILESGVRSASVVSLRRRLAATGDLPAAASPPTAGARRVAALDLAAQPGRADHLGRAVAAGHHRVLRSGQRWHGNSGRLPSGRSRRY